MKGKLHLIGVIIFVTLLPGISTLNAQWTDDTSVNTLVCDAANDQLLSTDYRVGYGKYACVATEDDGFIVAWYDDRNIGTTGYDIYAQKFDMFGYEQWTSNGVPVCTASGDQRYAIITTDGDGGAIITWMWDDRNSGTTGNDVYAQRVSSNGTIQWTANGVAICTDDGSQTQTVIISDGSGGAIVSWSDGRDYATNGQDIYAQRINSNGTGQWTSGGVVICDETGSQSLPQIASDENAGAVITWKDNRYASPRAYAQRISSVGSTLWTSDGVHLGSGTELDSPLIVSDGDGGCIVAWFYDTHIGSGYDYQTFCQGVDNDGSLKWGSAVEVCEGIQHYWPSVVSDDAGGIIVAMWGDSDDYSVYAQRIDDSGARQWGDYGIAVCNISEVDQGQATITSDGNSGAILTWRRDIAGSSNRDIYAQRIDADGDIQWTADGIAICSATGNQFEPVIVSNEDGDAFIVWEDDRDSQDDLYCQLVTSSGTFPVTSQQAVSTTGSYTFTNTLVEMNFSALNGSGDVDVLQIPDYPGSANPSTSADVYWRINKGSGISSFTTSVTFSYAGHLGSMIEADLKLFRNDGSGWTQWVNFTLDMGNDEIIANNVSAFSDWAIATDEHTLPVELSSFYAVYSTSDLGNGYVDIHWVTSSETDIIGFNIYRAPESDFTLADRINLNLVEGQGTTTEPHDYSFIDDIANPLHDHYYWLESVDFGGISHYHGPIHYVPGDTDGDHITNTYPVSEIYGAFPNPALTTTTIRYQLNGSILEQNARISIYNLKGEFIEEVSGLNGFASVDVSKYAPGIYLFKISSMEDEHIKRFIVVK